MKSGSRLKSTLGNIALFLGATLAMLLVVELATRLLLGEQINMMPRYHTDARYGQFTLRKLRPNSDFWHKTRDGSWRFVTNSQGFRSYHDYNYEKPEGTIRAISLGDSQMQGYEARQNYIFPAIVERYLQREGYVSEVLNTGISGFSNAEQLIFLENEGIKYQPEFVLVGFFVNDLDDNVRAGLFRIDDNGELAIAKKEYTPGVRIQNFIYAIPGVQWLSENSYLYSYAFNSTWLYFKDKLVSTESAKFIELAVSTQTSFSDYQIELAAKIFERMFNFCQANGIKLFIIDIPYPELDGYARASIPEALLPTMRRYSDAFINGEEVLADYAAVAELHVPHGDWHITEFTHAVLGVEVAKQIVSILDSSSTR
jgi:hypothetical protein